MAVQVITFVLALSVPDEGYSTNVLALSVDLLDGLVWFYGVLRHSQQYFCYIMAVSSFCFCCLCRIQIIMFPGNLFRFTVLHLAYHT